MIRYRFHRFLVTSFTLFVAFAAAPSTLRAMSDTILVLRPGSEAFHHAFDGLSATVSPSLEIETLIMGDRTSLEDVAEAIELVSPKLVVLMDNLAVLLYQQWQMRLPVEEEPPPSLVLMTLYADIALLNLRNATAISYEVLGITGLTHLRDLMIDPLVRVGVVYSSSLEPFFLSQQKSCLEEDIELVGVQIPINNLSSRKIRSALNRLLNKEKIDALWIFNDSQSLSGNNLTRGWLPVLIECTKPVLVGVENLMEVGHLGVFPDHYGMGEQAGNLVLEINENDWELVGDRVRPPISVVKTVNMKRMTESKIKVNAEKLDEMDNIIQ